MCQNTLYTDKPLRCMCVIVVLVINSCCIKGSFKAIYAHLGALPDVQGVRCGLYTSFAVCVCLQ